MVQCFQHEVRVHLRQRLCPISIFYELLCPITFQEVLALQLFRPLLHEILSVLHQRIPSHQICLYQRFFLYVAVGAPHDSFDLVPFTALPYLTVNARAAPPAFPCKYLITVSANYFGCKWIAFRPVGIGVCPMLLQILFPAFYFKLYTFPNLSITLKFCTFFTLKKCTDITVFSLRVIHLFPLVDNFHQQSLLLWNDEGFYQVLPLIWYYLGICPAILRSFCLL